MYEINTNYLEIIAGTSNTLSPVYREAAEDIEKGNENSLRYMKNFITSIENLASKTKDQRISQSAGNIKNFSAIKSIDTTLGFLKKNLGGIDVVKDCAQVYDALERYQSQYVRGYEKKIRMIQLEYESAVYMLTTALSMAMANNMEIVANGTEIKIQKRSAPTHGVIDKTLKDLAKQLSNSAHKDYLEQLIKEVDDVGPASITEAAYYESNPVADTIALLGAFIDSAKRIGKTGYNLFIKFKNSLFGIVPLIRSVLYLKYKKKADTILSLEQQAAFIEQNIEQLQNMKNMDEEKKAEIIQKQKATAEAYMKKAEKLRAQLMETEKDASTEIQKENPQLKDAEDDFVLESAKEPEEFEEDSEIETHNADEDNVPEHIRKKADEDEKHS